MWIENLNIVKMSGLPKLTCRFNAIPIETPESYFLDIDKLTLKLYEEGKRHRITITINKWKKMFGGSTICLEDYKHTVIKTVWYWSKYRLNRTMELIPQEWENRLCKISIPVDYDTSTLGLMCLDMFQCLLVYSLWEFE